MIKLNRNGIGKNRKEQAEIKLILTESLEKAEKKKVEHQTKMKNMQSLIQLLDVVGEW